MLDKPLNLINLDDIQRLIDDEVQEGKTIEYKREAYRLDAADADYKKKQHEELLKDVSSFANTVGGHLILGVEEDRGVPRIISGINCDDPDALKLRWIQIIENGLEPRVALSIKAIPFADGQYIFVFEIMQSLVAPHRAVLHGEFGQFWARNSGGAYRMDTSELRQSFIFSSSVFDQIKQFRTDRLHLVRSGETPVPMQKGPKLLCHLIPQESFSSRLSFVPDAIQHHTTQLRPLNPGGGWSHRFNMDGIVTFGGGDSKNVAGGYVQLFRSGILEVVEDGIVYTFDGDPAKNQYFSTYLEHLLVSSFPSYLKCLTDLGISPPVWCFLTLTDVKGVSILLKRALGPRPPIDRETLILPEIRIDDLDINPFEILKPLFDMIWNSAGFPKCMSFDESGNWKGD